MSINDFLVIWLACLATMLLCRCLPIFILKERQLPEDLQAALNLIPPAAFAALVANDLFKPDSYDFSTPAGIWAGAVPLIAALVVALVGKKTGSLIWCAVVGVICYALLVALPL